MGSLLAVFVTEEVHEIGSFILDDLNLVVLGSVGLSGLSDSLDGGSRSRGGARG